MMKKKIDFTKFVFVLFFSGISAWYLLEEYVYVGVMCVISMVCFLRVENANMCWKDKQKQLEITHQFASIINASMMENKHLYDVYKQVENALPLEFINLSKDDFTANLIEYSTTYPFSNFTFFSKSLALYEQEGNEFIKLLRSATFSMTQLKYAYHNLFSSKKKKMIEMTTLYGLWILSMFFLRTAYYPFYRVFVATSSGGLITLFVLLIGVFSFSQFVVNYYNNHIKGI